MDKKAKLIPAMAGLFAAAAMVVAAEEANAHAVKKGFEKCAGIVKQGMNDCGANGHSCAGVAAEDNDPNEWIMLPKGSCERIVGGRVVK